MSEILSQLSPAQRQKLGEVVRFGIVGVLATALQYAIYWVLIHVMAPSLAMTVGYGLSFIFNFIASTRYTFKVEANAKHGAGFALSHVVNYLLHMVLLAFMLWLGVPERWAPAPVYCVAVPINFLMVRYVFKNTKEEQ